MLQRSIVILFYWENLSFEGFKLFIGIYLLGSYTETEKEKEVNNSPNP
jgi:hypothetical protein